MRLAGPVAGFALDSRFIVRQLQCDAHAGSGGVASKTFAGFGAVHHSPRGVHQAGRANAGSADSYIQARSGSVITDVGLIVFPPRAEHIGLTGLSLSEGVIQRKFDSVFAVAHLIVYA
jgi:hypothetical protein